MDPLHCFLLALLHNHLSWLLFFSSKQLPSEYRYVYLHIYIIVHQTKMFSFMFADAVGLCDALDKCLLNLSLLLSPWLISKAILIELDYLRSNKSVNL